MKRCRWVVFVMLISLFFPIVSRAETNIETPAWRKVEALGKKNSYAFLFFGDAKTEESKRMRTTLKEIKQELTNKMVDIVEVMPDDSKEKELAEFFGIKEKPCVLVIAPNGAVTGYFPGKVNKKALLESLVSLKEAEITKNLQERCVVFLCFYKDAEPDSAAIKASLKAVADNFKGTVSVVYASSDDKKEEKLREKFKMSSGTKPTVFIIVPPGRSVAKLEGADITKENLMRALLASCGSGCGSGCR